MKVSKKELKEKYGGLFSAVSLALFNADPININYGDNSDEYDSETGTIIPRLKDAFSAMDVQKIIFEEFCHWFDAEDVGSFENYGVISQRVWELWREYNQ